MIISDELINRPFKIPTLKVLGSDDGDSIGISRAVSCDQDGQVFLILEVEGSRFVRKKLTDLEIVTES